ncbi:Hypothetical predicted protein, partial [Pelobates cultripes]
NGNLSKQETKALKELRINTDLITPLIREFDNVVVLDKNHYIRMAELLLND